MSGLVSYQSSDEDEDDLDQAVQKAASAYTASADRARGGTDDATASVNTRSTTDPVNNLNDGTRSGDARPTAEPAPASLPARPSNDVSSVELDLSMSPYSDQREKIQSLTMPRFANFNIPPSPPPPEAASEAAADLTARTRKFERFLQLKKQGVHFNDRLEGSTALRNPALLQKLMDFAGIEPEDQYDNTLGKEFGVPTKWPERFLESLVRDNEKRVKKEREGRSRVDFVAAQRREG